MAPKYEDIEALDDEGRNVVGLAVEAVEDRVAALQTRLDNIGAERQSIDVRVAAVDVALRAKATDAEVDVVQLARELAEFLAE